MSTSATSSRKLTARTTSAPRVVRADDAPEGNPEAAPPAAMTDRQRARMLDGINYVRMEIADICDTGTADFKKMRKTLDRVAALLGDPRKLANAEPGDLTRWWVQSAPGRRPSRAHRRS